MADTGSEVVQDWTRTAAHAAERVLVGELRMRRAPWAGAGTARAAGRDATGPVEVAVRCPAGGTGRVAEELMAAMSVARVDCDCTIYPEESMVALTIGRDQCGRALSGLERIARAKGSTLDIDGLVGIEALEQAAGRRAVGHRAASPAEEAPDVATEAVALTFSDEPDSAEKAEAFAARMRGIGLDASARPVEEVATDGHGQVLRTRSHVVAVAYPQDLRDVMLAGSAVALHELGIAGHVDPLAGEGPAYEAALATIAAHMGARDADARQAGGAGTHGRPAPAKDARGTHAPGGASAKRVAVDAGLLAEHAGSGAARDYRLADVARQKVALARELAAEPSPVRADPSIGGR